MKFKIDGNTSNPDFDIYYPIHFDQVHHLVGQLLTQVEALGLPEPQSKAAKDVFKKLLYDWWFIVTENSKTAAADQLKPIEFNETQWRTTQTNA